MDSQVQVIDRRMQEAPETDIQLRDNSPAAMMIAAMSKGMDLDKLEKFMALQERYEANEARKAYHEAMAEFKKNPPKIEKDRHVKFDTAKGSTEYSHASLANVTEKINAALGEHGLSAAWKTEQTDKGITVTCTITHKMGHFESTSLTAAPDLSGSKNAIQAVGSSISYLERYTILALTGLATAEMDNDGQTEEVEYLSVDQQTHIKDLVKEVAADEKKFLEYLKCESIEKIPAVKYNTAIAALEAKRAKGAKK